MPADTATDPRSVIGIGGLVARSGSGIIITHALGSCLGIAVHDQYTKVGAMIHAQLPLSTKSPDRARQQPALFVDLSLGLVIEAAVKAGAERRRLRICVAGAANVTSIANDIFNIAKQNITVLRKVLWQAGVLVAGEDTGGTQPRTMTLDVASGQVAIDSAGRRQIL